MEDSQLLDSFQFQHGPVKVAGLNGGQNEHLLAIVLDRLIAFQGGPFACQDNDDAMQHVRFALDCLQRRTADRQARGVEGRNEP